MSAGLYDFANLVLEEYVFKDDELDGEGNKKYCKLSYSSTHDLIWIAEKLGRFDLAEQLYEILKENGEDIKSNVAFVMNYGHIQLMNGNIDEALHYYQQSMDVGAASNLSTKDVKNIISDDFSVFHWLNIGDKDLINQAAKRLNIRYKSKFYTSLADSVTTKQFQERLVGNWALEDSSLEIEFDDEMPLCLYKFTSQDGFEIARLLTNCRYSNKEGKIYLEELNQTPQFINNNIQSICSGEIISISDTIFSIRIIDNGNESDKGKTQTYYKVKEDK